MLVLVEGIYLTVFGKSISLNSRVNRRLEMLERGQGREQVLEQLRKEMQQHMKSRSIPLYSLLADRAQKAAIAFTPRQLVMIMGGLAVFAFIGLSIGTETDVVLRVVASIGIGIGGVFFWVNSKAKTHFARSLIQARLAADGAVVEDVPSPTFTLVQTYDVGFEIWHADLYRLSHPDEAVELGLIDAFDTALCLVEWPEKLGRDRPESALTLRFSLQGDGRSVSLSATGGDWKDRLRDV